MSILDVLGPVMIGPSSSHTAGAVRLGLLARGILDDTVAEAEIYLHGSFAETYKGHGTDMALVAGLMGWKTDDARIPQAMEYAEQVGLKYKFIKTDLGDLAHPNTVLFKLIGASGKTVEVTGCSVGGGQVLVNNIDGMDMELTGKLPAILTNHIDKRGVLSLISGILANAGVNIATMRLFRDDKGGIASMVIECDNDVPQWVLATLDNLEFVINVRFVAKLL